MPRPLSLITLVLVAALGLAGCESSEERAERHFRSGIELLEKGEVTLALVELRNVFKYNTSHREGRLTYARVQRERGQVGDAYSQYLRVAEQYPEELEARVALAEMAIDAGQWEEAVRHGRAAQELAPADPAAVLVGAVLDYREAALARDRDAATSALDPIRARLEAEADNLIALRVLVDHAVTGDDPATALETVQSALAQRPEVYEFHAQRLRLLIQTGEGPSETVRDALEEMVSRFPADERSRTLLVAWHMERGDLPGAEAVLRREAEAEDASVEVRMTLVEFIRRSRGAEPARAELAAMLEADPEALRLHALSASIQYDEGLFAEGIAALETVLAEAPESADAADKNMLEVLLARMLLAQGRAEEARARIDAVLEADASQVEALKMRAAWMIDEDQPSEAIQALRSALAQAPRDAQIMTLMARAHERQGDRALAGERYAQAVEVSERAAPESLRYAAFLVGEERIEAAEAVLTEALARSEGNIELMRSLGDVHLRRGDFDRALRLVWQLRAMDRPQAIAAANGLEAELLMRQDRVDDTIAFLEGLVGESPAGDAAAVAALIQTQVRAGRIDAAREMLDERLAAAPDQPALRFLRAGMHVLDGELDTAEGIYRDILTAFPGDPRTLRALYGLMRVQDREEELAALLDAAIEAAPGAVAPQLLKAEQLERGRDFEGAIAVYEALYAANSANVVVANNLASLLVTHRDDDESLARAYTISRRLRDIEVPAVQDTYGWIAFRRGEHEEALRYLEPAAQGLPDDPVVQYHLGMAYAALGRRDDAVAQLTRALEIAGADNPLPQFVRARETLAGLQGE